MKIAVVSTPFVPVPPRDYGGTELVLGELVNGLVRRRHEVTLYATGDSESEARLRSLYREAVWPPSPLPDVNHASWAVRDAAARGAEVIHVNSPAALAFSRFTPTIPFVYTLHHDRVDASSSFYGHFPDVQYVAISADQASREVEVPRKAVIHHGLDPAKYEWTTSPGEYLFFIGRFASYKGVHTAIDIAERVGRRIRVAGTVHPESRAFGEREVRPRLGRRHVRYVGPVGMREKTKLMRDARALVAPITWNEPFGLVFIEAMLSGCPVVAYPRGSVPEVVDDGVTGFIVRDEREMADVVCPGGAIDEFDRKRCRVRAAERFATMRMVRDYERTYHAARRAARRPRDRAA